MKTAISKSLIALSVIAAVAAPMAANAESNFTTGAGSPLTATARVDFSIIIPKFVSLRVGALGTGNFDLITFTVPGASVGAGGAGIAGTGGTPGPGAVTATVTGNNGQVTLTANATAGGLSNGADVIPFTQITTGSSSASLPAPVLVNGPSAPVLVALTGTKITNQTATWTYNFSNSTVVASGTYAGTVTYTASMP